ncbi:hypothetical protein QBC47DRAFT_375127 [Echria macrotheca]|uniref:Uncharacterized protein n=1 Tax=Echria macrotheca TaxID=438768 RepID=A0AAJ0BIH3_9PEZI|nr:hypothetical protein QBC47DRAFT_375127 [Echria macrotheca]
MASTTPGSREPSWSWPRQHVPLFAGSSSETIIHGHGHEGKSESDDILQPRTEVVEKRRSSRPKSFTADRDIWTRDLCIVGLILGWGAAAAAISTAAVIIAGNVTVPPWLFNRQVLVSSTMYLFNDDTTQPYIKDQRVYLVSDAALVVIPLLLQVCIAFVSGCLESIHSTTLRWALWREGRLAHNTNLRLFTCARGTSGPNAWPANLLSCLGYFLTFGGSSVMLFPLVVNMVLEFDKDDVNADPFRPDADLGPNRYGISFNGWGLLGLGIGLLLQSVISTWCLIYDAKHHVVGTWNSNPLATARACRRLLDVNPSSLETSVSAPAPGTETFCESGSAGKTRSSLLALVPATRTIANWIWASFVLHAIFTVTVAVVAVHVQHSASLAFVRDYLAPVTADFDSVWKIFGLVTARYNQGVYGKSRSNEWAGLLIQSATLSTLLVGLHLADLFGRLMRDEAIWRRAATPKGASFETNMILEEFRNWPSAAIFVYKAMVPWIFSFGVACNVALFVALLPLVTIAVLYLILGLFIEYLIRAEPNGRQPATYGDVRALLGLVDDWNGETIFWRERGRA